MNIYLDSEIKNEYKTLWNNMSIIKKFYPTVSFISMKILKLSEIYKKYFPDVPFFILGFLHYQNNNFSFYKHLHNNDSLEDRTVSDPVGRPADRKPPFTWRESAEDYVCLISPFPEVITVTNVLFFIEKLENFKYRKNNIISPTLWFGSSVFDNYNNPQYSSNYKIGIAPIIKYMINHDIISIPL